MTKTQLKTRLAATALAGAVAGLALSAPSVHAAEGVLRIHVGDLDLSRAADVEVARHRMKVAIRAYCTPPAVYPVGYAGHCKRDLADKAEVQLAAAQALSVTRVAGR